MTYHPWIYRPVVHPDLSLLLANVGNSQAVVQVLYRMAGLGDTMMLSGAAGLARAKVAGAAAAGGAGAAADGAPPSGAAARATLGMRSVSDRAFASRDAEALRSRSL